MKIELTGKELNDICNKVKSDFIERVNTLLYSCNQIDEGADISKVSREEIRGHLKNIDVDCSVLIEPKE